MAEKIVWEDGADVTAEDIAAALKPLVDEYFFGNVRAAGGGALLYAPRRQEVPHCGGGDRLIFGRAFAVLQTPALLVTKTRG